MSLCLIDVHGDIEGDFEWVEDLPKNRKEFLIAIEELEKIKDKIKWEVNGQTGAFIKAYKVFDIIDNHISELKGE